MKTKKVSGTPAIGSSSLIAVFAVLCLSVFAVLTLSTAQSGERVSKSYADAVEAYYSADADAEAIFAEIRKNVSENNGIPDVDKLPNDVNLTVNGTAVLTNVEMMPDQNSAESVSETNDGWIFKYNCAADEKQELNVQIRYDGDTFKILEWKTVRKAEWIPDDSINVWDGE